MNNESIKFKYPLSKLKNAPVLDEETVEAEYRLNLDNNNILSIYSIGIDNEEYPEDSESLKNYTVKFSGEELLSLDTCFRIYMLLKSNNFSINEAKTNEDGFRTGEVLDEKALEIANNHITVARFIKRIEETICSINYFNSEEISQKQRDNNKCLRGFIDNNIKELGSSKVYNDIEGLVLGSDEDREHINNCLKELAEYDKSNNGRAPYHIYDKMASIIDKDYSYKRDLLRSINIVHTLQTSINRNESSEVLLYGTNKRVGRAPRIGDYHETRYVSLVLDDEEYKNHIIYYKDEVLSFQKETVNCFFAAELSGDNNWAINIMKDYIDKEENTKYQRRYSIRDDDKSGEGKGCFGILVSGNQNKFAFSGFQDVDDPKFRTQLKGAGDKLSTLINRIENAVNQFGFKGEKTNRDEVFFDSKQSSYIDLNSQLPIKSDCIKEKYICCEKKLFSHVYQNLTKQDNVITITTFEPCIKRGCRDLINELRKTCNSICCYYIDDYSTGHLCVSRF